MKTAKRVAPILSSMRIRIRRIPRPLIPVLVLSFAIADAQTLTKGTPAAEPSCASATT
jgi:hypothetical protein